MVGGDADPPRSRSWKSAFTPSADITPDWRTGRAISVAERHREVLAAANCGGRRPRRFGPGEHHRTRYRHSPAIVSGRGRRDHQPDPPDQCGDDPSTLIRVRVFQDFATVDLVPAGRAELIAGRGASSSPSAFATTSLTTMRSFRREARPALSPMPSG
jgi:hypothetical protein